MILGISASARKDRIISQTVKAILDSTGLEYEFISLAGKSINGCIGCTRCAGDNICKVNDDWNEIAEKMLKADAIVFGAPNYFATINALGHAFLERTFCFRHREAFSLKDKIAVSVSTYRDTRENDPVEAISSKAQVNYAAFKLSGVNFSAMDNAFDVDFNFNEAFSLIVNCNDQKEIDYYWSKLSAVPEAEQCGWVKDQFGVSWQIVPSSMDEILLNGTKDEIQRVTEAFLKMKKFDLNALEQARLGN
jgi:predicted 3-demethylubiquinone-9 3-methyltransferase (glyoxalase superfamily)